MYFKVPLGVEYFLKTTITVNVIAAFLEFFVANTRLNSYNYRLLVLFGCCRYLRLWQMRK